MKNRHLSSKSKVKRNEDEATDPSLLNQGLTRDIVYGSEGKPFALLRLKALNQVKQMLHQTGPGFGTPPTTGISNWIQMGPTAIPNGQTYSTARVFVTGRVTSIVVDATNSNIIYVAGAQGGVWKSIDKGITWQPTCDNEVSLAIGALAMDPTNNLVLYAGTGEENFSVDSYYGNGVLKTIDGGNTWTQMGGNTFTGCKFSRIVINPSTHTTIFASTSFGVFRSIDGGQNWTQMTNGLPANAQATDVVINPNNPDIVYAAFWGDGIYQTTNANAATPQWTQMTNGLPTTGFRRIALGLSSSSPQTIYALMSDVRTNNPATSFIIDKFYITTNGGTSWTQIPLPGGNIGGQGFYNLNVTVDPTTPDIVYLSGISLWKAVRNSTTNVWTMTEIGLAFHSDNHALVVDPSNNLVIYAGSDGGIFKSVDGGTTWSDSINKGLCITQFEFMDQHPTSDAVIFAGTQDNGTEQFRNSPVFYHADDGDGGYCSIDQSNPVNVIHEYFNPSPTRSTQGGKFGTWQAVSANISGNSLFYPPFSLDKTNQNNIALGTDKIFLDSQQGTNGWPTVITLPNLAVGEVVSAINYVNSNLIYVGTSTGSVYSLVNTGGTWTTTAIHNNPLPSRFIWDIAVTPGNNNIITVVMSGFGTSHVWQGTVPATGTATWVNISGTGQGQLPDIPVNSITIDPNASNSIYIGTDVGVFSTTNGGTTWVPFSDGLPNCAVFDLRLHAPSRLLRAVTHGRGMWERKLDVTSMPDVNIFVRDNIMDTARFLPTPAPITAAFEDPLHYVSLGDQLYWWMCADVKIDALEGTPPSYQFSSPTSVDYIVFESKLQHLNAERGLVNRVYVQIHNRGIKPANNVTVKILYADASAGLPTLPSDFWSAFPANSANTTNWIPIGSAQVIPTLSPTQPMVLEWDWTVPQTAADHSCILVIVDCPDDPIPAVSKVFDVGTLVSSEKRAGLKNLHIVNPPPATQYSMPFHFYGNTKVRYNIMMSQSMVRGWKIGLLLPGIRQEKMKITGITQKMPTKALLKMLHKKRTLEFEKNKTHRLLVIKDVRKGGTISGLKLSNGKMKAALIFTPTKSATNGTITIIQKDSRRVIGGSTFVLHTNKNIVARRQKLKKHKIKKK